MGASDFAVNGQLLVRRHAGRARPTRPSRTSPSTTTGPTSSRCCKQARRINPQLTVMATPWSPPGWMKTSDSMIGGTLRPDAYQPLADYFAKFLEEYAAAGVPIRYVTPQNEPLFEPGGYPGMGLSAEQADDLIKNYLGPDAARPQAADRDPRLRPQLGRHQLPGDHVRRPGRDRLRRRHGLALLRR